MSNKSQTKRSQTRRARGKITKLLHYHQNTTDRTEVLQESTSQHLTTTDGTEVLYKANTANRTEQKLCVKCNVTIITAPTCTNQHSPTSTNPQQQPQLQPFSRKYIIRVLNQSNKRLDLLE